jgi:glutathione S-transferase
MTFAMLWSMDSRFARRLRDALPPGAPRNDGELAVITLYDFPISGNCYKLRLLMHILDVPYQTRLVDFYPGREHKAPWFLELNPLGQLPVLQDDDLVLRDAQAILVYLASKYDHMGLWYPRQDAAMLGQIAMWLAFADLITGTASAARLHDAMFYDFDIEACRAGAHRLFRILDEHLWFAYRQGQDWLCSKDHPTIADIACFPYVMLSEEGGVSRQDYSSIRHWTDRVKQIPRFIVMPGIFAPARAA